MFQRWERGGLFRARWQCPQDSKVREATAVQIRLEGRALRVVNHPNLQQARKKLLERMHSCTLQSVQGSYPFPSGLESYIQRSGEYAFRTLNEAEQQRAWVGWLFSIACPFSFCGVNATVGNKDLTRTLPKKQNGQLKLNGMASFLLRLDAMARSCSPMHHNRPSFH